jgi:hypothetical protein
MFGARVFPEPRLKLLRPSLAIYFLDPVVLCSVFHRYNMLTCFCKEKMNLICFNQLMEKKKYIGVIA